MQNNCIVIQIISIIFTIFAAELVRQFVHIEY